MANKSFILLRYSNDCDINGLIFQPDKYFDLYLDGVLGEPKYEHDEAVNENDNKEIEFTRKTLKKSQTFITTGGEWMADVLNIIRLCKSKILINKAGEVYNINEMECDGNLAQGIAIQKIKFTLFTVTNAGCGNNNILLNTLPNTNTISDYILDTDYEYIHNASYPIGALVVVKFVSDGYYLLLQRAQYTSPGGIAAGWIYATGLDEFTAYNRASSYWQKEINGVYGYGAPIGCEVVPLPYIETVSAPVVGKVSITGQCLQGYVIGVQKNTGTGFVNVNIPPSGAWCDALMFNGSGVQDISAATGDIIRLYCATLNDPATPLCYSNQVNVP